MKARLTVIMGDTIRPPWILVYGICSSIISFGVLQDFGIMPGSFSAALLKLMGKIYWETVIMVRI